ncbi:MAG TPA: hypothetical protein VJ965_03795 [Anaerolineales bacterium]|nr:hypothetical protein [Anaerolineales bacterium]
MALLDKIFPNTGVNARKLNLTTRDFSGKLPSLEMMLAEQRNLPPFSLFMGICEDGLPLVLDFLEPGAGSFLIASDSGFDNTALMHSLITAAIKANSEDEVYIHLISPHADDLLYFHWQPNFKISYDPFRPEVEVVLEEMVNLVAERQHSGQRTPVHLFAIDGLDILQQALSAQSKIRLDWLIEHGPAVGFWIFATIESTYISPAMTPVLDLFSSRILGRVSQPNLARSLSGLSRSYLYDLHNGLEYFVRTMGQSFNIWMLQSEDIKDTDSYMKGAGR